MIKNLETIWFKLSDKLRFLLVGGFNFVVSYIIYVICIFIFGKELYQAALALSWIISSVISFTTQRIFVFPVKGNLLKQYIKCCFTWVFSYLINSFLLWILVSKLFVNVFLGQIFAVSIAAIFTYIMFKLFAFKAN